MVPTVSVVIPVYNGASFLSQAIESVKAQTLREWELVIVNDGSIDSSGAIAQSYAADGRIRVIHQSNGGVAAARNRGLAETGADTALCTFLDADDYWQSDALSILCTALDRNPSMIAVRGLARYVSTRKETVRDNEGEQLSRKAYVRVGPRLKASPAVGKLTLATLARRNVILSSGAVIIRQTVLRRVGAFDQIIAPVEDWDMWLRLCCLGEVGLVNKVVLNYRLHSANASLDSGKMLDASKQLFCKHLSMPGYSAEQVQLLRIGRRYRRLYALGQRYVLARKCLSQRHWAQALQQLREALNELT